MPEAQISAADLIAVFNREFAIDERTVLVGGGAEPEYFPPNDDAPARLLFREDYVSSALHEVAHWCVAGPARRLLPDFGYWYAPDGRSETQQRLFEQVEVKPQAIEWALSLAAGVQFHISADNLMAGHGASETFRSAVFEQCCRYFEQGLPNRAARLFTALQARFQPGIAIVAPGAPV